MSVNKTKLKQQQTTKPTNLLNLQQKQINFKTTLNNLRTTFSTKLYQTKTLDDHNIVQETSATQLSTSTNEDMTTTKSNKLQIIPNKVKEKISNATNLIKLQQ